jgi:thioredoxin 1
MKSRFSTKWAGLAASVLVGTAGVLAYCHVTSDCLFASTPNSNLTPELTGEKPMSTDLQNAVIYADEESFGEEVLDSKVPVLVDFYADWCGPCRALSPVLEQLADETPNAKIVKVNVDENPQLAGRYRVSSIPNLLVFRDGKVTDQQVGLASKQQLKTLLLKQK